MTSLEVAPSLGIAGHKVFWALPARSPHAKIGSPTQTAYMNPRGGFCPRGVNMAVGPAVGMSGVTVTGPLPGVSVAGENPQLASIGKFGQENETELL
jgi:hypothetical protein